jgi:hypothetical protein
MLQKITGNKVFGLRHDITVTWEEVILFTLAEVSSFRGSQRR